MNILLPTCVVVGLYFAYAAGCLFLKTRPTHFPNLLATPTLRPPLPTLLLTLAIAIPATLQFFFPAILSTFQRDYARFIGGDW